MYDPRWTCGTHEGLDKNNQPLGIWGARTLNFRGGTFSRDFAVFRARPYPKPSIAPEAKKERDVVGGEKSGGVLLTLEVFTKILSEGVIAMEQAIHGDEVYIHGDFARVTLDVPLGADTDGYFEKAKRAYIEKCEEIKRKLGG